MLIDTAEMYGDGVAEEIVAEAVEGCRDECFIVSKVLPENSTRAGAIAACERSLRRLKTDRIDLYLLHWRGRPRLEETLSGFEALSDAGAITTSSFSNQALEFVRHLSQRVILIDGERLADLMIEHNVAVRLNRAIEFKRLDEDFFAEGD
jgi:diketogulonate reductase-like aldo/keto reductase